MFPFLQNCTPLFFSICGILHLSDLKLGNVGGKQLLVPAINKPTWV